MLTIYEELEQGSDAWFDARRGMMSASELNLILSPTLKPSNNEKTRAHCYELAAQRLSGYTEPTYVGDNMIRGWEDEIKAREKYSERRKFVYEIGGMCRDFGTFKLWASPDGLIGGDGGIEVKSRIQKHHLATIETNEVPKEHILQVQSNLLVSGRDYWEYISYCGGWPMWMIPVEPDPIVHAAIIEACESFEVKIQEVMDKYADRVDKLGGDVIMTEREIEQEIFM